MQIYYALRQCCSALTSIKWLQQDIYLDDQLCGQHHIAVNVLHSDTLITSLLHNRTVRTYAVHSSTVSVRRMSRYAYVLCRHVAVKIRLRRERVETTSVPRPISSPLARASTGRVWPSPCVWPWSTTALSTSLGESANSRVVSLSQSAICETRLTISTVHSVRSVASSLQRLHYE